MQFNQPLALSEESQAFIGRQLLRFDAITADMPTTRGSAVAKQDRNQLGVSDASFIYGEISFQSFAEVFELVKSRHGGLPANGVFYDLGSGTGKAVVAAALLHEFEYCRGIELLEGLFQASLELKTAYEQEGGGPRVEFIHGDLLTYDWSDASCLFVNSTCFSEQLMRHIAHAWVHPGTIAITSSKNLKSPQWRVLEVIHRPMSWGGATLYVQQCVEEQ